MNTDEKEKQSRIRGAEMLEGPTNGSFTKGLEEFVAWVKSLVASNPKT